MTTKPVTDAEVIRFQEVQRLAGLEDALDDLLQSRAVEAVGAVPVTDKETERLLSDGGIALGLGREDEAAELFAQARARTAPPSTAPKAQDDLAGAERERAALLCEDLAVLMENGAGDPDPGGRLRQAARNIRSGKNPIGLASQPKAPAPVPVVQGEAIDALKTYVLIARMFRQPDELLRSMMAQDLCRLLHLGPNANDPDTRAAHLAAAGEAITKDREMFTTPPGGAGGDAGAMSENTKATIAKHLMKLVTRVCAEFQDYSRLRNNWTGGEALKARKAYRATLDEIESGMQLLATPAPEQATTGSGQGDRIEWPKENRVGRREDMSPDGVLIVGLDSDNDVYVEVSAERHGQWQSAAVEFCNGGGGGGQSSRTRAALINLMTAIEADNAELPHKAFPGAAILSTASPAGVKP